MLFLTVLSTWTKDFPAWLEAVSTFLGFVAAAIAAVDAVRIYKRETARERRMEDVARRAQASLVSGWIGIKEFPPSENSSLREQVGSSKTSRRPGLWLRNASEVPVFDLRATVITADGEFGPIPVEVLPPAEEPTWMDIHKVMDVNWNGEGRVALDLVDSGGQRWSRTYEGWLIES
jgi:hypothetical protein